MNIETELKEFTNQVNKEIQIILQKWKKEVSEIHPRLLPFIDAFTKACIGGKRIRGFLVKKGFDLVSAIEHKDILKVAAAVEIMHTAILVHDDIIDKSPLRRGKPSLYKTFGENHYALSQAISIADAGFFLAIQEVTRSLFLPEQKIKAIEYFTNSMKLTTLGELLDVSLSKKKGKDEQDIITVDLLKTAQYTFVSPLQIGAILGGGNEDMLKILALFGENIGIAFQIQDDILGVFGNEEKLGKSVYSDVQEGKNTFLISYALSHANKEQKKLLEQHYGLGSVTPEIFQNIKDVFEDTRSLAYSKKKGLEYMNAAKDCISNSMIKKTERTFFYELVSFLEEREF